MKTLEKKQSHISTIIDTNQTQLQEVCSIIDWTAQQYCNYQFDQYTEFLKSLFFGYPEELYKDALYSPVMRGFWNNEASKRNELEFLPFGREEVKPLLELLDDFEGVFYLPASTCGAAHIIDEFMFIHSAKRLINDEVFMAGYARTLQLIK